MPVETEPRSGPRGLLGLATLALVTGAMLRFTGIGGPEPFVDEGGNVMTALDPRVRAIVDPIGQARPLLAVLFKLSDCFPKFPLETARLQTGIAGLATAILTAAVLRHLWGDRAALLGLWLWAVFPLLVFHERLALQDPYVALALAATAALLTSAAARDESDRTARNLSLAAGLVFGLALMMKISALLALGWLIPLHVLLQRTHGRRLFGGRLAWIAGGALLPLASILPVLPRLGRMLLSNHDLVPPSDLAEWGAQVGQRTQQWLAWQAGFGGWPLLLLGAAALLSLARQRDGRAWWLAIGCLLTFLGDVLAYNRPYARYSVPDAIPLILFLSAALGAPVSIGWLRRSVILVALGGFLTCSAWIALDLLHAPVPRDEIRQYLTGPWSGRGAAEVRRFLDDYSDRHGVACLVLTHRAQRPGCYALMLAERGDARLGVVPQTVYEPAELDAFRPGLRHVATGRKVACFLLYEGSLYPAPAWLDRSGAGTRLVHTVDRGGGETFQLYQFEP